MPTDTLAADGGLVTLPPPPNPFFGSPDYSAYKQISLAVAGGNPDELLGLAIDNSGGAHVVGYSVSGALLFSSTVAMPFPAGGDIVSTGPASGATDGNNGAVFTVTRVAEGHFFEQSNAYSLVVNADGTNDGAVLADPASVIKVTPFSTPSGYALEWIDDFDSIDATGGVPVFTGHLASYTQNGAPSGAGSSWSGNLYFPFADTSIGGRDFTVFDNQATLAGSPAVTVPGEPVHAMTDVAATGLADGSSAAVAWVDSGTDYVAVYDAATNSFGPVAGLDWGGASDLHLVALPDGGFVVSWENGGAYKGDVFDAAGNGGGIIPLAGDAMAIDSHGDLYTVGKDAAGEQVVQTYAINGGSSGGGGTTGQTFNSDNNGDTWVGTAGNDVFNLGRGGDTVTGNGGNDTYNFAGIPWAGGHITDFNAGDVLDLTGLMSTTSDTGTDGFADGYLKIASDSAGNAQVWADYHIPGNDGWWLVETLDGVSASSLTHSGDAITVGSSSGGGGPTDVSTSDSSYTAPASVKSITLTGSHQTIEASATSGVTINSNDSGNALIGGAGDDLFHLGRGGDWATGGAGADTFAYAAIPWAGGGVTDFSAAEGDRIDVSGLLANASYTGADPIADGYLKFGTDGAGNAQLLADYNLPGNDVWWLVATLDGVSTSSLHYANGLIT